MTKKKHKYIFIGKGKDIYEEGKLRDNLIEVLNKLKGIGMSTFAEKEKVADQILALIEKEEEETWEAGVYRHSILMAKFRKDLLSRVEGIKGIRLKGKIQIPKQEVISYLKASKEE